MKTKLKVRFKRAKRFNVIVRGCQLRIPTNMIVETQKAVVA